MSLSTKELVPFDTNRNWFLFVTDLWKYMLYRNTQNTFY